MNRDTDWNLETLHQALCRFRGVSREYPFDAVTGVYKVGGKMFALVSEDAEPLKVTLKCEPERAEELRQKYANVVPGYYMNKKHWNTITLDGTVGSAEVGEWMQDSYDLIFASLTRAVREQITSAPPE